MVADNVSPLMNKDLERQKVWKGCKGHEHGQISFQFSYKVRRLAG